MSLKADEVEHRPLAVLLAQLNDRIPIAHLGVTRIGKSDRLHGSEAEGISAAPRHDLNGHTALKNGKVALLLAVKIVKLRFPRAHERIVKRIVLLASHGAVQIIGVALAVA